MARLDDMVFTPSIGRQRVAAAPVEARERNVVRRARGRKGVLRRLVQARAARRVTRRRRARGVMRRTRVARNGVAAMRSAGAARGGARALANPIGALVAAFVVAGAVALRLATGRSFENMGEQVNSMLLGDLDDDARAANATREQFTSDRDLLRIAGQAGRVNAQVASIADDVRRMNAREQRGAALFREDTEFQSNNVFDILILRGRDKLVEVWHGNGGADNVDKLQEGYGRLRNRARTGGKGSSK